MNSKTKKIAIIATLVICMGALIGIGIYLYQQNQQLKTESWEYQQAFDLQKEALEDEFSQLSLQYEGEQFNINNDSLIYQLETERLKVDRLREELRTVKSTNVARINELKKELATLRAVMRNYIIQIDSLNTINQQLTQENKSVKRQYHEASTTASKLKKEKEELTEQVTLASKLDATAISVQTLDRRGKTTRRMSRMEQLRVSFHIAKNITTEIGERMLYIRIEKPDGDVLIKDRNNLFTYEDQEINFSSSKLIEYNGEEQQIDIYWKIEEYLVPGIYRVDIFADNFVIGTAEFELED